MVTMVLRLAVLVRAGLALDNGLGRTPPMGYSSWNDCVGAVTEARIKNMTRALIDRGLAAKGYVHVNLDEGWLKSRDPATGEIVHDAEKFPSGMKALGDWIHTQEVPGAGRVMKYGLYTCRGTAQCATDKYHAPGSLGHERADAAYMAAAGADYVKDDSCAASTNHTVAFAEYATMRDALNATGRPIYFSLCGWESWYAPEGARLGNSWRMSGDGQNWGDLSTAINANAALARYAAPGAWNDPDLLEWTGHGSADSKTNPGGCFPGTDQGGFVANWYQTERQARAQFTMWNIMSAPLLLSANIAQLSDYAMDTYGNEAMIAVGQTFPEGGPYQGERLVGGDVHYSKAEARGNGTNVWGKRLPRGDFALAFLNNGPDAVDLACGAACFAAMGAAAGCVDARDLWGEATRRLCAPLAFTAEAVPGDGGSAAWRFSPAA